jgi:hypothetical protein
MVAKGRARFAQGNDFGMSGWIAVKNVAVEAASDDASAVDDDRAHGDFSGLECTLGATQGLFHPKLVGVRVAGFGHGGHCSVWQWSEMRRMVNNN